MKVRVSLNVELCDFSNVMNAGSTFKDALFLKKNVLFDQDLYVCYFLDHI